MALNLANNNSLANITALPSSISGGAMTLLATQTASGSASLSFTSGIDDTYDKYVFKIINMHPASDDAILQFNLSADTGSNYNVTKTSTFFEALHLEDGSESSLSYVTGRDIAQGTGFADLTQGVDDGNSADGCGTLQIFSPSSTTFVKHFIFSGNIKGNGTKCQSTYVAGYGNTTSAVDAIQFKFSSGNIDSGVIKLYGIS